MGKFLKEHWIYWALLSLLAFLLLGFIYKDNTLDAHDLNFHFTNIMNIVHNHLHLSAIMPNIAHNLGYGLYIFYPALPHFTYAVLISFFHILSVSYVDGILFVNVLTAILASIFTYLLSYRLSRSKQIAFLSALIYLFFPYRLGTITVRMAINENFAGIFLPIIVLGLTYLFDDKMNKKRFLLFFTIGYIGLIWSHYLISMYFTLCVILFFLLHLNKMTKERLLLFFQGVLLVSVFVLPNILLFLEHYGKDYLVYLDNYVTALSLIQASMLKLRDLVLPTSTYDWTIPYYISFPVLLLFLYSSYHILKNKKKPYRFFILLTAILLFFIVYEPIWEVLPSIFYNIQFPWRMLLVVALLMALVAPSYLNHLKPKQFAILVLVLLIPTCLLVNKLSNRIYHTDYQNISLESGTGNNQEYYPTAYLSYAPYYEVKDTINALTGTGYISLGERNDTQNRMEFQVFSPQNLEIEFPKLCYRGYRLVGKKLGNIQLDCNEAGLLTAKISASDTYTLEYVGTVSYRIAYFIRGVFVFALLMLACYKFILKCRLWN